MPIETVINHIIPGEGHANFQFGEKADHARSAVNIVARLTDRMCMNIIGDT